MRRSTRHVQINHAFGGGLEMGLARCQRVIVRNCRSICARSAIKLGKGKAAETERGTLQEVPAGEGLESFESEIHHLIRQEYPQTKKLGLLLSILSLFFTLKALSIKAQGREALRAHPG